MGQMLHGCQKASLVQLSLYAPPCGRLSLLASNSHFGDDGTIEILILLTHSRP
jgi:hypothetical protein